MLNKKPGTRMSYGKHIMEEYIHRSRRMLACPLRLPKRESLDQCADRVGSEESIEVNSGGVALPWRSLGSLRPIVHRDKLSCSATTNQFTD